MSRLTKQEIRDLCLNPAPDAPAPLISPFLPEKIRVNGTSKGLSHASYDCSIDHDLVLGVHPGFVIKAWLLEQDLTIPSSVGGWVSFARKLATLLNGLRDLQRRLRDEPRHYSLAYTVEDFCFPADLTGMPVDKSTYARLFVSAMNTFFDCGFHGNATLELVNFSDSRVTYQRGDAVCQFIFDKLTEASESPYNSKYQHQKKGANPARFDRADGTYTESTVGLLQNVPASETAR